MAVVNIDLSEYDAVRSRVKELEEQVEELKKDNEMLKSNTKVILRKETQVEITEYDIERFSDKYGNRFQPRPKVRRTLESSESYVNFEDVRLKVENHMREELERSIKKKEEACEQYVKAFDKYSDKYSRLDAEFNEKRKDMEKTCREILEKRNDEFRDEYRGVVAGLERKKNSLVDRLKKIDALVDVAIWVIDHNIFCGNKTKKILQQIQDKTVV